MVGNEERWVGEGNKEDGREGEGGGKRGGKDVIGEEERNGEEERKEGETMTIIR